MNLGKPHITWQLARAARQASSRLVNSRSWLVHGRTAFLQATELQCIRKYLIH